MTSEAKKQPVTLMRLLNYLRPYRWQLCAVALCMIGGTICAARAVYYMKPIINDYVTPLIGQANPDYTGFFDLLGLMALLYLSSVAASALHNVMMIRISTDAMYRIRSEMFHRMAHFPLAYFDTHSRGQLMSYYSADVDALSAMIMHFRARYREETVRQWVFEMSFFLNDFPYYDAPDYSIPAIWDKSYELIKSIIPGARLAGPGMIPDSGPGVDDQVIRRLAKDSKHMPDIFTSMSFPYLISGELYHAQFVRNPQRFYFAAETARIREALNKIGFTGEYWVTDFGISISNRNYIQDSCYRGTEILNSFLE